jgi:osmotically-inducible protein OsmY
MLTLPAVVLAAALAAQPDGWITAKSKLLLIQHPQLDGAHGIHVDSNDGVVTLYGKVKDPLQRSAAERIVRGLEGVRAVKNLLQSVPPSEGRVVARADADLLKQARQLLAEDPALRESRIHVKSVDNGVVLLTGQVNTLSDQLRAVSEIDQLAGVRRVVSQLEGPEQYGEDERHLAFGREPGMPARDSLSDTRITAGVKLKLLSSNQLPALDINVDTRDGIVTLFGTVPNHGAKERAEAETAEIAGVIRVRNQLEIVPRAQANAVDRSDSDVSLELLDRLRADPAFTGVQVEVKNGAVRVTGSVASGWDKLQVLRMVRQTAGVTQLHEELDVRPREKRRM